MNERWKEGRIRAEACSTWLREKERVKINHSNFLSLSLFLGSMLGAGGEVLNSVLESVLTQVTIMRCWWKPWNIHLRGEHQRDSDACRMERASVKITQKQPERWVGLNYLSHRTKWKWKLNLWTICLRINQQTWPRCSSWGQWPWQSHGENKIDRQKEGWAERGIRSSMRMEHLRSWRSLPIWQQSAMVRGGGMKGLQGCLG